MPRLILSYLVLIFGLAGVVAAQVCTVGPVGPVHDAEFFLDTARPEGLREERSATSSPRTTPPESGPTEVSQWEAHKKLLSKAEPLRVPSYIAECNRAIGHFIFVRIVVDELGNVISAEPLRFHGMPFSRNLLALAKSEASTWKYSPFERDGKPVLAVFTEQMTILPLVDLPQSHVPFPKILDRKSLKITLMRDAYHLEIRGDGSVLYRAFDNRYLLSGEHSGHISDDAVAEIIDNFRQADYFSLREEYVFTTGDPCIFRETSISFEGHSKSVRHCKGEEAGMPPSILGLEDAIEQLAGTGKWLLGDAETVPSLIREGWDFKSPEASELLRTAVVMGAIGVVRDLLAEGVPPNGRNYWGQTALFEALGSLDMVRTLMNYGADPKAIANNGDSILIAAARTGMPDVVAEIVKYRPDVNARNDNGESAIEAAVVGRRGSVVWAGSTDENRAEVVRVLAKGGADLNVRDHDGYAPLHHTDDKDIVQALIESGADVNVRDNRGQTPLIRTRSEEVARLLIQAGADIFARDHEGNNAFEIAVANEDEDKVALLQAAQIRASNMITRTTQ